jgi:hypothetical protein
MYSTASRIRLIGIVEEQHSARLDAIKLARAQRSKRVADPACLGNLQASKHSSNVSARQGASCCNFQGKPVVYGGWTNGWNTIRNDVNILKTSEVQSSEGEVKKVLEWETLSCGGCSPPCTYGPVIVAAESKECGECLVVHGGVQFGGYAGPVCDLRVLRLIGTDSAGERRWDPHESVPYTLNPKPSQLAWGFPKAQTLNPKPSAPVSSPHTTLSSSPNHGRLSHSFRTFLSARAVVFQH